MTPPTHGQLEKQGTANGTGTGTGNENLREAAGPEMTRSSRLLSSREPGTSSLVLATPALWGTRFLPLKFLRHRLAKSVSETFQKHAKPVLFRVTPHITYPSLLRIDKRGEENSEVLKLSLTVSWETALTASAKAAVRNLQLLTVNRPLAHQHCRLQGR